MTLGDDGKDIVAVGLVEGTSAKLQCAVRQQWHIHHSKRLLVTNFVISFIVSSTWSPGKGWFQCP